MTTDYDDWDYKKKRVTGLLLDPHNPRIPPASTPRSQADLIDYLVEHDNVHKLAASIVKKGYFPLERLISLETSVDGVSGHFVLEGNRRVCALKLLLNPDSAPTAYRNRFRLLQSKANKASIEKVSVAIAPSRDAANPLILEKHTHDPVMRWTPAQQARFLRQLFDEGNTVGEIAEMNGTSEGEVRAFLRNEALYSAACSLILEPKVMAVVTNPRKFPLTTLARAFESAVFKKAFGVSFDDRVFVKGNIKKSEFEKGFKRVVSDIASGDVTSRTIHDEKDVKKYLATLGKDRPDTKGRGRFKIADFSATAAPAPAAPKRTPVKRSPRSPRNVVPLDWTKNQLVQDYRIREVFSELKKLKLADSPNASALLLRTLIDIGVWSYLESSGHKKALLNHHQKPGTKRSRPTDHTPTLRQMMNWMFDKGNGVAHGITGQAEKAIKKFATSDTGALDTLDKHAHNKYVVPTEADLRAIWTQIEPLLKVVLFP